MARVIVQWIRQGNIQWEAWWVNRYGYTRNPEPPGLKAHVGFANEDLRRNGLPQLRALDGTLFADVPDARIPGFREVIGYHGFRIELIS
jgi:hypothetical protein